MKKGVPIVWCVLFLSFIPLVKTDAQLFSTIGKEFWLSFPVVTAVGSDNPNPVVYITCPRNCIGKVQDKSGSYTQNFSVSAGQQTIINLPADLFYVSSFETVERKGAFIQASDSVQVFVATGTNFATEITGAIPQQSLGSDYIIMSYAYAANSFGRSHSQFLLLGVEDSTVIEVSPTQPSRLGTSAAPFVITLNKGETYLYNAYQDLDLSGSGIHTKYCKKLAVFTGSQTTFVPAECANARGGGILFEQSYPVNTLGTIFLVTPSPLSDKEYLKIVATQDNTRLYINGQFTGVLYKGTTYEGYISGPSFIRATKPVITAYMGVSFPCAKGMNGVFMVLVTPFEQAIHSSLIITEVSPPQIRKQFVQVHLKSKDKNQTFLDGQNIGSKFQPFPANPEYAFAQMELSAGAHYLKNDNGFTAEVSGYADNGISFGYSAGSLLTKSNQFALVNGISSNLQKEFTLCPLQTITFEAVRQDTIYSRVYWHFDDGSIDSGNLVNKTFSTAGCHNVQMISYYTGSSGNCLLGNGATDTTFMKVCVLNKLPLDVGADTGFCKGKSLTLQSNIAPDGFSYVWNTGETTPSIDVNKTGVYWLELRNGNCSVTDSITVTIVDKPIVSLQGSKILCTGDSLLLKNTVNNPSVTYLWNNGKTGYSQWIKQPGVYTLYANNKGCTAEGSLKAEEIICPDIYIPTAFTPNGDGKNDVLRPIAAGVELLYFRIYNRYGQLVFETQESGKGWDGKLAGIQQPMATYVFTAEARDNNGKSYFKKGTFVLIR